jgi:hypothetical protein
LQCFSCNRGKDGWPRAGPEKAGGKNLPIHTGLRVFQPIRADLERIAAEKGLSMPGVVYDLAVTRPKRQGIEEPRA